MSADKITVNVVVVVVCALHLKAPLPLSHSKTMISPEERLARSPSWFT